MKIHHLQCDAMSRQIPKPDFVIIEANKNNNAM